MKILLLLFLLVLGCKEKNLLDELENRIFELDEVYVYIEEDDMIESLGIHKEDYEDYMAMKTLIVYEQKEFYVFYELKDSLKHQLNKEGYILIEMDGYVYFGVNDLDVIQMFKDTLNK